jgi:predicted ATPase/class 3 adenylate cyclase/Tfp pilus assembly protein PilF
VHDTFTFLFTDIEGSTLLWEQRAAEMRTALERHDAILRDAVEASRGRVVKTTGDGMFAVFDDASDALAASIAAQRALQASASNAAPSAPAGDGAPVVLKVRMGVHTGDADVREGDYWGTSVNRAARIMSAARGEQILVSAATASLVHDRLPDGVSLRDLGEHRLKGLVNPEQVLQVVAAGLRTEFAALATQTNYNLPAERDAFVDRIDALADLDRRLAGDARLVSVLGLGGTGKTRLVTHFAWHALARFAGGVWFCDLAQARGLDGVVHAVAQGLDVPLGKEDPVVQLGHAIAGRGRCLVVLDNFEQVARHAEDTLGRWLARAPAARFVVTTRELLGVPGEETLALAPLPAPDAAELFSRRAAAAKPGFAPNAEDAAAIGPLVRLLDGLPLAVELAAARVRVMPPRTLLARMTERFKLLSATGGRIDRQATLRAVFDWSWDLLSLPEKAALAQLSVFEGGFTLEAVEAMLDLSACDEAPWPVDVLQSLVQKSLVRVTGDDRFDLLVSVQEYAAEHLRTEQRYAGSGPDARRAAEARHGTYFASLDPRSVTANRCADLDNVVVACRRAAARGDTEVAVEALERAWAGLRLRGPFRVGVDLAAVVASMENLSGPAVARIDLVAGCALQASGRPAEARARLESAVAGARGTGNRTCEARALVYLGMCLREAGDLADARSALERALAIAQELGDPELHGTVENNFGNFDAENGRLAESRVHYDDALRLARASGDRSLEAAVLGNLGLVHEHLGMHDRAATYCEAALAAAQEAGDRKVEGNSLCNLGLAHFLRGRLPEARDNLEAAVAVARDIGHPYLECVTLCNVGIVQEALDDVDAAERSLERAREVAREMGNRRLEGQVLGYLGRVFARRGAFAEARRTLDTAASLLRAMSDPESLAIVLAIRAETEQHAGDGQAARAALSAAEAIAAEVAPGAASELGVALARARRAL